MLKNDNMVQKNTNMLFFVKKIFEKQNASYQICKKSKNINRIQLNSIRLYLFFCFVQLWCEACGFSTFARKTACFLFFLPSCHFHTFFRMIPRYRLQLKGVVFLQFFGIFLNNVYINLYDC